MTRLVTICLTHFKGLALANLEAALYSVKCQEMNCVQEVVVLDNDSSETQPDVQALINSLEFTVPVRLLSYKHGDANKTHSWSTNAAVREATSNWVLFTRSDYVLDFNILAKFHKHLTNRSLALDIFLTGDCYQLNADVGYAEQTSWRKSGPVALMALPGVVASHTAIDTGVWMSTRRAFDLVGGLDEKLTAWGHAQTHFQWKLHRAGVEIVRIPEVLYYHPLHSASRDLAAANAQLAEQGIDVKELWARYEGEHVYR